MALRFELVTPEKLVRSEDVYMVTVPGTDGDFGVLENHAPLVSTLRDGELLVFPTQGASPTTIRVEGGFAEVNNRGLTVLADRADI
jgi:F-type H+-transporting ATPase subunit epsilon